MSAGTDGVTGLDVSKYQTTTPSLVGQEFLIARATIGTRVDPYYAMHIANAKKAGVMTGAYHFNYNAISVASQVSAFLATAGNVDLYVLDVEGADAFSHAQSIEFIKGVKAAHPDKPTVLYHSLSGFFDAGQDLNWVAYWSSQPPPNNWHFWQWGGYNGIDANRWHGTLAELHALRSDMTQATVTSEAPKEIRLQIGAKWYDLDGTTVVATNALLLDWRPSPYAVGTKRAMFATVAGARRIVLVAPAAVDIRDVPVVGDDGFTKATQDAAIATQKVTDAAALAAAVTAQKTADATALAAAVAAQKTADAAALAAAVAAQKAADTAATTAAVAKATSAATVAEKSRLRQFLGL